MKGCVIFILLTALYVYGAAGIVVLTEKPVSLFRLPTGEVFTNAYAFKRSSSGMMVIHDGGSFWLNYKTLPGDWRQAYMGTGITAQLTPPSPVHPKTPSCEDKLKGFPESVKNYVKSPEYHGELDDKILTVLLLRSVIDRDIAQIKQLKKELDEKYPYSPYAGKDGLLILFKSCKTCKGTGRVTVKCKTCGGSGKCPTCGGDGKRDVGIGNDTIYCTKCRGTGLCPDCKGSGGHRRRCPVCKGKGRILDRQKCADRMKSLMRTIEKASGNS